MRVVSIYIQIYIYIYIYIYTATESRGNFHLKSFDEMSVSAGTVPRCTLAWQIERVQSDGLQCTDSWTVGLLDLHSIDVFGHEKSSAPTIIEISIVYITNSETIRLHH